MIPYQPLILAIANRMRDGWITELTADPNLPSSNKFLAAIYNFFVKHSQMGRILWAIPFAWCLSFLFPVLPFIKEFGFCMTLIVTSFLSECCTAWGTSDHPAMGETKPIWALKDLLTLGAWGLIFVSLPAAFLLWFDSTLAVALFFSGLFIVPAYVIGWELPGKWHGTAWGAFIFGACIGAVIYLRSVF